MAIFTKNSKHYEIYIIYIYISSTAIHSLLSLSNFSTSGGSRGRYFFSVCPWEERFSWMVVKRYKKNDMSSVLRSRVRAARRWGAPLISLAQSHTIDDVSRSRRSHAKWCRSGFRGTLALSARAPPTSGMWRGILPGGGSRNRPGAEKEGLVGAVPVRDDRPQRDYGFVIKPASDREHFFGDKTNTKSRSFARPYGTGHP